MPFMTWQNDSGMGSTKKLKNGLWVRFTQYSDSYFFDIYKGDYSKYAGDVQANLEQRKKGDLVVTGDRRVLDSVLDNLRDDKSIRSDELAGLANLIKLYDSI